MGFGLILFTLLVLAGGLGSSCERWEDPTEDLPELSTAELDALTQTDTMLVQIKHLRVPYQLDSMLKWAAILKDYDEPAAANYAQQSATLATEHNRQSDQAIARYYLALLESGSQMFAEGMADPLVNARISYRYWHDQPDHVKWKILTAYLLGDIHYRQEQPDSSIFYYEEALALAEKHGIEDQSLYPLKGSILHGMGNLALYFEEYDGADSLYQEAQAIYEADQDTLSLSRLQQELARLNWELGNDREAVVQLEKSINMSVLKKDYYQLASSYQQLGNMFLSEYRASKDTGDFHQSLDWFKQSLAIQKENFYYTYRRIGRLMQSRANRDPDRPDFVDSALVYYRIALEKAREEGALDYFKSLSSDISVLCDWLNTKDRNCVDILGSTASNYLYVNYSGVVDTITSDLSQAIQYQGAIERRQQQVESQRRIRTLWITSGIGLSFAVMIFLLLYQKQKQKRLEARMEALRAQINPHFFSNSLNAIESLINLDQRQAASKYLIHFSRLTRRILNSSMAPTTSLAGELETTKHFLALEQLRFKDKLKYNIEVDPEIHSAIIEVPALILQPYLENAIWHGIKPKTEPGMLEVIIKREGAELLCTVEDDGIGREQAAILKEQSLLTDKKNTNKNRKSVGMKITKERLERFGGGKVEIVDLVDPEGEAAGTRVVIRLPYKTLAT